jgi:hypothetical protein
MPYTAIFPVLSSMATRSQTSRAGQTGRRRFGGGVLPAGRAMSGRMPRDGPPAHDHTFLNVATTLSAVVNLAPAAAL